ncbi:MAG: LemA family protein [Candidatus Margulisbacteria bacterium]|nr:LemA family protein [Candidatus Margulisiibacteriota bacterium]
MEITKKKWFWPVVLAVLILLWGVGVRNSLITQREGIPAAWAEVENQLQRRFDLIPNLVSTTKGYVKHEREVFTHIADARAKLAGAKTLNDKVSAVNSLESAISRLLVVVENYPKLQANTQFIRLMDELAGAENRIAVARRRYNEIVRSYNLKVKWFPSNIIAKSMGFKEAPYLEATEQAKGSVPKVEF